MVVELLLRGYTSDSENLARKNLTLGLTWSLLQNDAGLKRFFGQLDDFLYRRRILGFISESPGLDSSAMFDPPFPARVVALIGRIEEPRSVCAILGLMSRTLPCSN